MFLSNGAWVLVGVCAGLLAAYTAWCFESGATFARWVLGLVVLGLVILAGLACHLLLYDPAGY
jgi:hypothetical protein